MPDKFTKLYDLEPISPDSGALPPLPKVPAYANAMPKKLYEFREGLQKIPANQREPMLRAITEAMMKGRELVDLRGFTEEPSPQQALQLTEAPITIRSDVELRVGKDKPRRSLIRD